MVLYRLWGREEGCKALIKKRYWILMPPFLIIGIVLMKLSPQHLRPYVLLIPIVFWIVYYLWGYIEKKRK
ncbi:hypothetical protein D9X91_18930 [Falsibacillus albus]|uniref:Uncharacterized protein n=1 Tax=Falsibacillus albus TaxID=2478915 RepID=A0A3L7JR13_9BACI|nr:hypothetical protein D9X91_18930 [Falsibacillus albus]